MHTLVIKGHQFEASAACSARGIDHWLVKETLHGETIMETDAPMEKITAWFIENCGRKAPYPVGSLLWYREGKPSYGNTKGNLL